MEIIRDVIIVCMPIGLGGIMWVVTRASRSLKLMHIDLKSTDYALEKSIGNGYTKDRLTKKKELMTDFNFKFKD